MAMEPEAAAALQEIKNEAANARTTETNKTKLLVTLLKLKQDAIQEQKDLEVKMAGEYMDLQKNAVNAIGSLERTIVGAKTSRSNAELAAQAAEIRSVRAAANKTNPGYNLFRKMIGGDVLGLQVGNVVVKSDEEQKKTFAENMIQFGYTDPNDKQVKGAIALAESHWNAPIASILNAADSSIKEAHSASYDSLRGMQTSESDKAAAALATDGALDRVLAGTASDADYDQARAVLGNAINKIDFSEENFKLSSDAELLAREKGPEGEEYETVVGELQRQIDDLQKGLFGEGTEARRPEPTDEEEQARLIASPQFREWAADHGFKIGYAEQAVNEDGTPKLDANDNAMADMDTYEPGPDDKDAIHYAVQTVHGNAPTGPNKREPVAGLTSIKLAADPDSYEAGQERKNLLWPDGKYHKATNVDTGESHYMPPAMGGAVAQGSELMQITGGKAGDAYIKTPDGKVFWVKNGQKIDITERLVSDPNVKAIFDADTASGWRPLYKKGSTGAVPLVPEDIDSLVSGSLDFENDPGVYGGIERNPLKLPENIKMEATDEVPTQSDSIWVARAPRDLRTDIKTAPRTAHAADGKVLFQYDPQKTVRSADGEIYLFDIGKQAYHARSSLDTETLAEDAFSGRGVKPANMTAEEWAAEQSRLPKEERLDKQGVRPEVKGTAKELKAADEAAIAAQDAKQGEMVNVPTIGGTKRKAVPSEVTEKGKERLNKFERALSKFDESLNLKEPVAKAADVPAEAMKDAPDLGVVTEETPIEIKQRKGKREPTPDPEAERRASKEWSDAVMDRLNRAAEKAKQEKQVVPIPGTRQLGGPLLDARDERRGRLKRLALEAKANSDWDNPEEGDRLAAEAVAKEKENLRGTRLDRPTNVMEIKDQQGSVPKGKGFTSPEIRAAKKPIITSDVTSAAQSSATKWASSPEDTRMIPKAAKDISATTGIDRAEARKMLIEAKKKNLSTQK
jgi:hypothetical protein